MDDLTLPDDLAKMKGAFVGSLVRNNKKIKEDRAIAIAEEAQMKFKRKVEDLELQIKQIKRERESMLDMSPGDTTSLILASDFNGDEFVAKDIELGIKIRNLEIAFEIAESRYNHLFNS